jgi:hypothetical protein
MLLLEARFDLPSLAAQVMLAAAGRCPICRPARIPCPRFR